MPTSRSAIGTAAVVAAVLVIIAVGAAGYVAYNGGVSSTESIPIATSTSLSASSSVSYVRGPNSSSTTMSSGIELTESVNDSLLTVGQSLNVSVSILNTQTKAITNQTVAEWAFGGVPAALWPTCYGALPAQVVVLAGNYSAQNIGSAANVTLNYVCAEAVDVDHVTFQPNGDEVNLTGVYSVNGANETLGPFHLSLSFTTGGAWNLTSLAQEPSPPIVTNGEVLAPAAYGSGAFTPGVYTVAVADEWGQLAILHVVVAAS